MFRRTGDILHDQGMPAPLHQEHGKASFAAATSPAPDPIHAMPVATAEPATAPARIAQHDEQPSRKRVRLHERLFGKKNKQRQEATSAPTLIPAPTSTPAPEIHAEPLDYYVEKTSPAESPATKPVPMLIATTEDDHRKPEQSSGRSRGAEAIRLDNVSPKADKMVQKPAVKAVIEAPAPKLASASNEKKETPTAAVEPKKAVTPTKPQLAPVIAKAVTSKPAPQPESLLTKPVAVEPTPAPATQSAAATRPVKPASIVTVQTKPSSTPAAAKKAPSAKPAVVATTKISNA